MAQSQALTPTTKPLDEEYLWLRDDITAMDKWWRSAKMPIETSKMIESIHTTKDMWRLAKQLGDYKSALNFYFRFEEWSFLWFFETKSDLDSIDAELHYKVRSLDRNDELALERVGGAIRRAFENAFEEKRFHDAETLLYQVCTVRTISSLDAPNPLWRLAALHDPVYRAWQESHNSRQEKNQ